MPTRQPLSKVVRHRSVPPTRVRTRLARLNIRNSKNLTRANFKTRVALTFLRDGASSPRRTAERFHQLAHGCSPELPWVTKVTTQKSNERSEPQNKAFEISST